MPKLLAKASLIIKKDIQRKEEAVKDERRRVKAQVKKKLREKVSCGTNSADSSHFSHPSGPSARAGGSAPSESGGGAWNGLLDPLGSSYVARNGQQINEKAVDWGWNDDADQSSSFQPCVSRNDVDENEKPIIKGDLNHEYLDTLQDCNDDYNFSDNYLTNIHDASLITPVLTIPTPELSQNIFPPIGSVKSGSSRAPPTFISSDIAPPPLSVSFSQMISSHSRPNIPIGNIPSAVEKVLKRRKTEAKKREEKKYDDDIFSI